MRPLVLAIAAILAVLAFGLAQQVGEAPLEGPTPAAPPVEASGNETGPLVGPPPQPCMADRPDYERQLLVHPTQAGEQWHEEVRRAYGKDASLRETRWTVCAFPTVKPNETRILVLRSTLAEEAAIDPEIVEKARDLLDAGVRGNATDLVEKDRVASTQVVYDGTTNRTREEVVARVVQLIDR